MNCNFTHVQTVIMLTIAFTTIHFSIILYSCYYIVIQYNVSAVKDRVLCTYFLLVFNALLVLHFLYQLVFQLSNSEREGRGRGRERERGRGRERGGGGRERGGREREGQTDRQTDRQ